MFLLRRKDFPVKTDNGVVITTDWVQKFRATVVIATAQLPSATTEVYKRSVQILLAARPVFKIMRITNNGPGGKKV